MLAYNYSHNWSSPDADTKDRRGTETRIQKFYFIEVENMTPSDSIMGLALERDAQLQSGYLLEEPMYLSDGQYQLRYLSPSQ
jgi:hypothetical protein